MNFKTHATKKFKAFRFSLQNDSYIGTYRERNIVAYDIISAIKVYVDKQIHVNRNEEDPIIENYNDFTVIAPDYAIADCSYRYKTAYTIIASEDFFGYDNLLKFVHSFSPGLYDAEFANKYAIDQKRKQHLNNIITSRDNNMFDKDFLNEL